MTQIGNSPAFVCLLMEAKPAIVGISKCSNMLADSLHTQPHRFKSEPVLCEAASAVGVSDGHLLLASDSSLFSLNRISCIHQRTQPPNL